MSNYKTTKLTFNVDSVSSDMDNLGYIFNGDTGVVHIAEGVIKARIADLVYSERIQGVERSERGDTLTVRTEGYEIILMCKGWVFLELPAHKLGISAKRSVRVVKEIIFASDVNAILVHLEPDVNDPTPEYIRMDYLNNTITIQNVNKTSPVSPIITFSYDGLLYKFTCGVAMYGLLRSIIEHWGVS